MYAEEISLKRSAALGFLSGWKRSASLSAQQKSRSERESGANYFLCVARGALTVCLFYLGRRRIGLDSKRTVRGGTALHRQWRWRWRHRAFGRRWWSGVARERDAQVGRGRRGCLGALGSSI